MTKVGTCGTGGRSQLAASFSFWSLRLSQMCWVVAGPPVDEPGCDDKG